MLPQLPKLLGILALCSQLSSGFEITYPQPDDTVHIYRGAQGSGIPLTWSYNSTDDITQPLRIQYVEMGPRGEQGVAQSWNDLNVTDEHLNIHYDFHIAAGYIIRGILGQDYTSVKFDLVF